MIKEYSQEHHFSDILFSYIKKNDNAYRLKYIPSTIENFKDLQIKSYHLTSQFWPEDVKERFGSNLWIHKLDIYIPKKAQSNNALLYINGGYTYDQNGKLILQSPKNSPDFIGIALTNEIVVVDLQNVPNQFLSFEEDFQIRKEDEILAYSYKKVLSDPYKNAYWAGHLPMAKSTLKAMDAVQEELKNLSVNIENFILAGASKRGWAAWLATIADERVSALISFVADVFNVQENIKHICTSYQEKCPPALKDYIYEGIIEKIGTNNMNCLMAIEDPISYLAKNTTVSRLAVPKYIVNSAGDDFSVPDSSKLYINKLPGSTLLRYIPNSGHYIDKDILSESINSYLNIYLNSYHYPQLKWEFIANKILVSSSHLPVTTRFWVATNSETRDFRFNKYIDNNQEAGNVKYMEFQIDSLIKVQNLYHIEATLPCTESGWQAGFIELEFSFPNGSIFTLSTEILVYEVVNNNDIMWMNNHIDL
jgi:PhoPQ-activated pathogenicity-related protein